MRRKRLALVHEGSVMVDFPQTMVLEHGDALALEDGRLVEVVAAEEELLEVTGHGAARAFAACLAHRQPASGGADRAISAS